VTGSSTSSRICPLSSMLKERFGHPTDAESQKSFATLAAYRDGGIFAAVVDGSGIRTGMRSYRFLRGQHDLTFSSTMSCSHLSWRPA